MSRRISQLGTLVRVQDGRVGTVVFNGLTGVGIKWGKFDPPPEIFNGTHGDVQSPDHELPSKWPWAPDAMLRAPSMTERLEMECVGEESTVQVLRYGLTDWTAPMEDSALCRPR